MSRKVWQIIQPAIEGLNYEFVGSEYLRQDGRNTLRVYIDRLDGIKVEDCELVSHQLSGVLDVENPIDEVYDLEVSSPGMDRPLFKEQDFERFSGQRVKIKLAVPLSIAGKSGRRNFTGTLLGMEQGKVRVEVDDEVFELAYEQIERARIVPQF